MAVKQLHRTLLGRGIYDAREIARLVRWPEREVAGWAVKGGSGLLRPTGSDPLSFYDLATAHIVAEMRRRGVPLVKIRDSRDFLASDYATVWPFAHAAALGELASGGSDVYLHRGAEVLDASKGGQFAFASIVVPLLRSLEFDSGHMAMSWRPVPGVVIDPAVQAGAPCVEGTRVTTELLCQLVATGEGFEDLAADYDLPLESVERAVHYERELAA